MKQSALQVLRNYQQSMGAQKWLQHQERSMRERELCLKHPRQSK